MCESVEIKLAMNNQRWKTLVEKVAYPVCILSILAFVPLAAAGIWSESESATHWKLAGTLGITAFASALALSATNAARDSRDHDDR